MTAAKGRPENGVRRRVIFQAWCGRCVGPQKPFPERDFKGDAAFDLAMHNVDAHGGSFRGEVQS